MQTTYLLLPIPQSAAVNDGLNLGAPVVDNGHGQCSAAASAGREGSEGSRGPGSHKKNWPPGRGCGQGFS